MSSCGRFLAAAVLLSAAGLARSAQMAVRLGTLPDCLDETTARPDRCRYLPHCPGALGELQRNGFHQICGFSSRSQTQDVCCPLAHQLPAPPSYGLPASNEPPPITKKYPKAFGSPTVSPHKATGETTAHRASVAATHRETTAHRPSVASTSGVTPAHRAFGASTNSATTANRASVASTSSSRTAQIAFGVSTKSATAAHRASGANTYRAKAAHRASGASINSPKLEHRASGVSNNRSATSRKSSVSSTTSSTAHRPSVASTSGVPPSHRAFGASTNSATTANRASLASTTSSRATHIASVVSIKSATAAYRASGTSTKSATPDYSASGANTYRAKPAHRASGASTNNSPKSAHRASGASIERSTTSHRSSVASTVSFTTGHSPSAAGTSGSTSVHRAFSDSTTSATTSHRASVGSTTSITTAHKASVATTKSTTLPHRASVASTTSATPTHRAFEASTNSATTIYSASGASTNSAKAAHRGSSVSTTNATPVHIATGPATPVQHQPTEHPGSAPPVHAEAVGPLSFDRDGSVACLETGAQDQPKGCPGVPSEHQRATQNHVSMPEGQHKHMEISSPLEERPAKPEGDDSVASKECPPLVYGGMTSKCQLEAQETNCSLPSASGTVATLSCAPLYQPGAPGRLDHRHRCMPSGQWSPLPAQHSYCIPICGQPTGNAVPHVREGQTVPSAAEFPWHVTVYKRLGGNGTAQICGGSLITVKHFVSAAHCFDDVQQPWTFLAAFAKIRRRFEEAENNMQFREIRQIHTDRYGAAPLLYTNDIALVELAREVALTAWTLPVCVDWALQQPSLQLGENCTVVGFGGIDDRPSEDLRFARLPVLNMTECRKVVDQSLLVYSVLHDKFCVGFIHGTAVGRGDSGGGLAFPNKNRVWFLRGVVSVGSRTSATYSYFTNITGFVPWMASIIQQDQTFAHLVGFPLSSFVNRASCGVGVIPKTATPPTGLYRKVPAGAFPWHAAVYQRADNHTYLCSGTLVSAEVVITAAHCVCAFEDGVSMPARSLAVAVGPVLRDWDGNVAAELVHKTNVVEVRPLPFYNGRIGDLKDNMAALRLESPATVVPICIDTSIVLASDEALTVFGWGASLSTPLRELTATSLRLTPRRICVEAIAKQDRPGVRLPFTSPDKFCAMKIVDRWPRTPSSEDLLRGDSGSGAVVQRDGLWFLVGVVSVKFGDGIFGITDVSQSAAWLSQVVPNGNHS